MIEIYTDASYCVNRKLSGWACCLVENGSVVSVATGYTTNIQGIINAEGHAIKMGILNFMMECDYPQTIILWCDNISVCGMLMRSGREYEVFDPIRQPIYNLLNENRISYHVNYLPRRSNKFAEKVDTLAKSELNSQL